MDTFPVMDCRALNQHPILFSPSLFWLTRLCPAARNQHEGKKVQTHVKASYGALYQSFEK